MLKITALLFNTFALLIYQLFFTDVVTITQNAPATAKAETEFVVEVTVKKGDIKGFAKLQLDLPVGFTAVEDINNGASFTFVNQSVKFIWMSLPAEKEFKISYKVLVAAGTVGDKTITGKLSYVVDNVKGTAVLEPPSVITVGDGTQPVVAATPPATPPPAPPVAVPPATPPVAATPPPPIAAAPVSTPSTILDASGAEIVINCFRTTTQSAKSPGEFPVEVTIKKDKLDGFAKFIETLPLGYTATVIEAKGAAFSFVEQKAKFVWGTLPTEAEFKISYKVTVAPNVSGDQTIEGVFSFINPATQNTSKFVLQPTSIKTGADEAGQPVLASTPTTPAPPKAEPKPKAEPIVTKAEPKVPTQMSATSVPSPQGKAHYKVQILALRKNKDISVVASLLNVTEQIDPEQHQGLNKYVVGYHTIYKEARDHREQIPKTVVAPWVVAYNQTRRITVQEALMITSQQWYR